MDSCAWVAAGYPVMAVAVGVLWISLQKANAALLREKEDKLRILSSIRDMLLKGGGS